MDNLQQSINLAAIARTKELGFLGGMDINESNELEALHTKLATMKKEIENGNENALSLLETRLLILTRLRKFSVVIEEGYRVLGNQGPVPLIYKCVLVGLCRSGKTDDCHQLLEQWKKSSPKDLVRKDVNVKIEAFLSAVKNSGVEPSESLIYLEKSLGLTEEWVYRNCDESIGIWRFRTPPRQHSGRYTLCQTLVGCFYGDDCPSAHSSEELEEWKLRMDSMGNNFFEMNSNSIKQLEPIGSNKYRGGFINSRGPRLINGQSNGTSRSKNGLFTTTQTFQFSNGRTVTTNCYTNENQFSPSYVIPYHTPYLNELIAKYRSTSNLSTLFAFEMDDVKFKPFSSLNLKTKNRNHHWAFALASREALRTVSLLHDEHRRNFHISDGTFYYGSRPLNMKNLHAANRNSFLQVLNTFIPSDIIKDYGGWPQWFYYKIELNFRADLPGNYRQAIVFDFKKDPKLLKEVSIEVEEFEEIIAATVRENNGVQVVVVDSNSGFPIVDNGDWISSIRIKEGKSVHLNKLNYVQEMTKILGQEISCRQSELKKLEKFQDLTPTNICTIEGEQKIGSQLYCTIDMGNSLNEDSPVGILLQRSCHQVLLTSSDYPSRSYMCIITEKLKTSIIIALGKAIVQDLALKVDRAYNFKVELNLDVKYFDKMKRALNLISEAELQFLFPDFTKEVIFDHDFLNIFLEGAFTLNTRQMDAYTAITNSAIGLSQVPPVILIGPFGTGKTYTLCQSVRKLLQCQPNCRILICTHSNSAADIYITSMDEWNLSNFEPLRVYFHDRRVQTVSNVVKKYCTFEPTGRFRYPTKEEICNHRVVVTTLSISPELVRIGLGKSFFTHIIIDEAAQVLETEAIEPFLLANSSTRIVLAGDHMQLSPELFSTQGSGSVNILERLNSFYPNVHPCRILLNENYRSHEKILKFAGDHFYAGLLRCSTIQPIHPHLYPLSFFSVRGQETLGPTSFFNSAEIQELGTRLEFLISYWPPQWGEVEDPNSIAILTPFTDQVQRLRAHLRLRNLGYVSVERVQNVQGKQFRVVFLSTVRTLISPTESDLDLGFLSNPKLFNTALTRAQSLVAVVGDPVSLCSTGKNRNIWQAFIQEAMLNKALHGIHYDHLKNNLVEIERHGEIKSNIPEYIPYTFQTNQQIRTPLLPLAQPTAYNSFYTNFGPSLLTNSTLNNNNSNNKVETQQPNLGIFTTNTPSFAIDNLQANFNNISLHDTTTSYGHNSDSFTIQNYNGLYNSNMDSYNSFYQQPSLNSIFNNNLSGSYSFPSIPQPVQRNIPILNGHTILNDTPSEIVKVAQMSHPPGFTERPGIIDMHTFEQFVKSMVDPTSEGNSTIENKILKSMTSSTSIIAKDIVSGSPTINNISSSVPTTEIENVRNTRSNSETSIVSPIFEFPQDDFPSLIKEQSKKPTDWIEVKPKKPKVPVSTNNNGKPKCSSEKTAVEKIEILVNMGFDKKRAIRALQTSDKDLDKAIELLLAGKERTGVKDKILIS